MNFYLPTSISFHKGLDPDFSGILDFEKDILLVVSQTLISKRPELYDLLPEKTITYNDVGSNPDIRALQAVELPPGIRQVIGLGGGSKLDAAKVLFARALMDDTCTISELLQHPERLAEAVPLRHEFRLIQLPTTFGSSAEITKWGTVWDWELKKKHSVSHDLLYADKAMIYPGLSLTAPFDVTAYTGLDTLSHAIESFWNVDSNLLSKQMSLKSIDICISTLPLLLKNLDSIELRHSMAEASVLAGLAFSQTRTAGAHAMSYPLTLHHNIPHGYACSLTLGAIFDLNMQKQPDLEHVLDIFRNKYGDSKASFNDCFQAFLIDCNVPRKISDFKVTKEDIPRLVAESFHPDRINNMQYKLTAKDIENILVSVL
jgi:alcohol dehydrogenase